VESQHFRFNEIESQSMNLHIVKMSQDTFIETPYWGGRDIQERIVRNKLRPFHYGISKEPIEFSLELALLDENNQPKEWTSQIRYDISKWLLHDDYKPFQTYDDLTKIYYGIFIDKSNLSLINNQGYMELTFRTNSPYAWSGIEILNFDLSNNTTSQVISLENKSNIVQKYKPKIEIELVNGETSINLINTSNGNKEFQFVDLIADEIVSIDNENELILSDKFGSNPLEKFNEEWLELIQGVNEIEVIGKCKIQVKSQFPIVK